MKVTVIGTGHVGLVTCVTFASIGHDVIGTDVDSEKIELLARGISPFYEAGLEEAMHTQTSSGRLAFTVDPPSALREAEVVFISLPGPKQVEESMLAPQTGILAGLRSGATCIDLTTNAPETIRRLGAPERPDHRHGAAAESSLEHRVRRRDPLPADIHRAEVVELGIAARSGERQAPGTSGAQVDPRVGTRG